MLRDTCRATRFGWRRSSPGIQHMRAALKATLTLMIVSLLMTPAAWPQGNSATPERVLADMDTTSRNFRSAEASFVWNQYQKVIDETETQSGKIYFRRQNGEIQMAAD